MSVLLRAHVIVIVTTGQIGSAVKTYAKTLAETTAHQAILVDGKMLSDYRSKGASALFDYFHKIASDTLQLKRGQAEMAEEAIW